MLSDLKSNFTLTPGYLGPAYLGPALNNSALVSKFMRCLMKKNYSDKKKTNKQKQKLKYWHQSTSNGMKNNQTKCLASGSNENLDYFVMVTRFNHNGSFN